MRSSHATRASRATLAALLLAGALAGCTSIPQAEAPTPPAAPASGDDAGTPPLAGPEARSVPDFCRLQERALDLGALDEQPTTGLVSVLQKLRDQAPDAVRQELNTLVEAFDEAVRDPAASDPEAIELATRAVTSWTERNCAAD